MAFQAASPPDQAGLVKGLSRAPLHFQNMVAELIDNAVATRPEGFEIRVDLSPDPEGGDLYTLRVWDNCTGIPERDLRGRVFALGSPPGGGSHLNEHGFGLKNVIAKAEQLTTRPWIVSTRDLDAVRLGVFYRAARPYTFSQLIDPRPASDWPSWGSAGTGSIVELSLPMTFLQSVAVGRRGALPRTAERVMDYLREHLGVLYRGYLEGGLRAVGKISTSISMCAPDPVDEVKPEYRSRDPVTIPPLTIGGQRVTIDGEVGLIDKNSRVTRGRLYYYRHAPESQGVDIRIGRRVMATRLIEEIWERDRHPSLNGVAGEFRLPALPGATPPTLNNKTSLDFDSQVWHDIAGAISQALPKDEIPHGGGKSEDDLRDELYTQINGLKKPAHVVSKEHDCGNGVYVDVFWDQRPTGGPVEIYEVKKGKAQPLDVYQLVMYWDSLVSTGVQPSQGHLVSDGETSGVAPFVTLLGARVDSNGKRYDLVREDWRTHGIDPDA